MASKNMYNIAQICRKILTPLLPDGQNTSRTLGFISNLNEKHQILIIKHAIYNRKHHP